MKRRTFDGIVTAVGFGLAVFLFIAAGLLNWGATFANDSVKSQLENQNISFPAAESMPEATKDQLAKWAEQKITTGEMARDYSDLYIWEHMKASAIAVAGAPLTYSEVSGKYMGMVRGGTGTPEEILNYLNTNINMILEDPSFKKNLEKDGILVRRNSRIEFGDFMKSEFTKYAKIVKAIDLKVE